MTIKKLRLISKRIQQADRNCLEHMVQIIAPYNQVVLQECTTQELTQFMMFNLYENEWVRADQLTTREGRKNVAKEAVVAFRKGEIPEFPVQQNPKIPFNMSGFTVTIDQYYIMFSLSVSNTLLYDGELAKVQKENA